MTAKRVDTAIARAITDSSFPGEADQSRVAVLRRFTAALAFGLWAGIYAAARIGWIPKPETLLDAGLSLVPIVYADGVLAPDLLTWVVRIRGTQ